MIDEYLQTLPDRPYEPANGYGHCPADLETAAVPAQLVLQAFDAMSLAQN